MALLRSRSSQLVLTAATVALVAISTGCGSTGEPHPATSGAVDRASGPAEGLGPPTSAPEVAEAYFLSIIDGDFSAAAEWVRRDQQGIVEALALGRGPGTQPTMSGSVSIAGLNSTGQTADGETASVTFVGKMCRTPAPSQAQPSPDPQCVENDDPQTDLPYFIVNLVHTARDGWRVTFGGPDGQE